MSDLVFVVIIGDMYSDSTTIHSIHKDEDKAHSTAQELESSLRGDEVVTVEPHSLED